MTYEHEAETRVDLALVAAGVFFHECDRWLWVATLTTAVCVVTPWSAAPPQAPR